jgi:hypothetical protein
LAHKAHYPLDSGGTSRPRDLGARERQAEEDPMSAPVFSKREILVAGGVGLLAATGHTVLRPHPGATDHGLVRARFDYNPAP